MQTLLVLLIVLHVLTGVFWAGSTFVMARTAGALAERLALPQFGSAVVTLLMGTSVWAMAVRQLPPMPSLHVLGTGMMCAVLALLVQGFALPAVRRLQAAGTDVSATRRRVALHHFQLQTQ